MDNLRFLKEENERLSQLAERDWLTGLYNRMAVEQKIDAWLRTEKAGTLFVMDVDDFKQINDRYGHSTGDKVLQGIATLLARMAFRTDILGRIGGDEFVIFMPVSQDAGFIESRCRQIEQRFQELPRDQFLVRRIGLTVCGYTCQEGDDYRNLFDRVDQGLLQAKAEKWSRRPAVRGRGSAEVNKSVKIDMEQIKSELSEPGQPNGALCQDYDGFVNTYRFMERRLDRLQSEVYSILFTLADAQGDFPPLQERSELMEVLHESIQSSLRIGDVFTRYSSCQFLTMICDASDEQTDAIAERIRQRYEQNQAVVGGAYHLLYNRYPLKSTLAKRGLATEGNGRQKKEVQDGKEQ